MGLNTRCVLFTIFIGVVFTQTSKIEATKSEIFFDMKAAPDNSTHLEVGSVLFGLNSETAGIGFNTSVIYDVSASDTILGDYSSLKWGVNCTDKNGCTTSGDAVDCSYKSYIGKCKPSKVLFTFGNITGFNTTSSYATMDFMLSQDLAFLSTNQSGVFALGPKSKFWSYLDLAYQAPVTPDYIELSVSYKSIGDGTQFNFTTQNFTGSKFFFQGRRGATDPLLKKSLTDDFWTFPNLNYSYGVKGDIKQANVCIVNTEDFLIAVKNSTGVIGEQENKLCGKNSTNGYHCTASNSTIDKADQIIFHIDSDKDSSNATFTYNPVDYISFMKLNKSSTEEGDNEAVFFIKDFADVAHLCSDKADIAVGRYFFLKSEFIMRKYKDGVYIGFNETVPKDGSIYLIILLLLGFLILAIIFAIIFLKLCKRKTKTQDDDEEEDEEYVKANQ